MRNILIFAAIAGIASAIAIYFVSTSESSGLDYVEDAADDAYDAMNDNINKVESRFDTSLP